MGIAYYKRYPRDFLEGTIDLTFEEKGAYALVLDLIYIHEGKLQDNAAYIAGRLGCSSRKWSVFRNSLIQKGKLYLHGGFISNFRADIELEKYASHGEKQSENRRRPNKNKADKSPKHHQPQPQPQPDREKLSAPHGAERVSLSSEAQARTAPDGQRACAPLLRLVTEEGLSEMSEDEPESAWTDIGAKPNPKAEDDLPAWMNKPYRYLTREEKALADAWDAAQDAKRKGPA